MTWKFHKMFDYYYFYERRSHASYLNVNKLVSSRKYCRIIANYDICLRLFHLSRAFWPPSDIDTKDPWLKYQNLLKLISHAISRTYFVKSPFFTTYKYAGNILWDNKTGMYLSIVHTYIAV